MISSHSATTKGSLMSPWAWMLASTSTACCVLPTFASQRGERGRNGIPSIRHTAGTNWMPQAVRKEAGPAMKEQP